MDSSNFPKNTKNLLTLKEAAVKLGVTVDELLNWNEYNILKPTITLTGEIGYTSEQIENFIKIQQLSTRLKETKPQIFNTHQQFPQGRSFAENSGIPSLQTKPDLTTKTPTNIKTSNSVTEKSFGPVSFAVTSAFSFVFFSAMFLWLSSPAAPDSATNRQSIMSQATKSNIETSELIPSKAASSTSPVDLRYNKPGNNLHQEGISGSDSKISMLNEVFKSNSNRENTLGAYDYEDAATGQNPSSNPNIGTGFKKVTNFASANNCPTCIEGMANEKESIFDEDGNISGEPLETDLLALSALSGAGMDQVDSSVRQSSSPLSMLVFLVFGILSAVFILKNQFALSGASITNSGTEDFNNQQQASIKKIIEVTQKTDGAVVLYFRNEEYKISKPELDSESDQFIARLMELVQGGVKEIDYDTLNDENIRFNTPLSKLVTRLGFVGIKRDLFFPRTSKNKVLFRRYITEDDLIAMRLTPEQISLQM
jgi:hypothetical protein